MTPKDHGLLFQEVMALALIDTWAPKTETRRLPTPTKLLVDGKGISAQRWRALGINMHRDGTITAGGASVQVPRDKPGTSEVETLEITPRIQVGDTIWAREGCRLYLPGEGNSAQPVARYLADGNPDQLPETIGPWTSKPAPALHMPRWATRYEARVTGVRFERLQSISHADAIAEGVECWRRGWDTKSAATAFLMGHQAAHATRNGTVPQRLYYMLWEQINGRGSWDNNPIVIVYTFERINGAKGAEA